MPEKAPKTPEEKMDWMTLAACRGIGSELFFQTEEVDIEIAKQICDLCPVRKLCLEYAMSNRIEHGVWGGMSEVERNRIARKRSRT